MLAHIARLWHLFTNFTKNIPQQSHQMLAMTLPAEVCTLNLFSLICPTVPVQHPQTSISLASWRMTSEDAILHMLKHSTHEELILFNKEFIKLVYSNSHKGGECVLIVKETLWKNLNFGKDVPDICKFNYNCNYSFWGKDTAFVPTFMYILTLKHITLLNTIYWKFQFNTTKIIML